MSRRVARTPFRHSCNLFFMGTQGVKCCETESNTPIREGLAAPVVCVGKTSPLCAISSWRSHPVGRGPTSPFHKGIEQKPFRVQSGAAFVLREPTSVPESGTPYAQYALCKARCCQSGYTFELVTGQIFALPNQAPACRALRNIYLWGGMQWTPAAPGTQGSRRAGLKPVSKFNLQNDFCENERVGQLHAAAPAQNAFGNPA